MYWYYGFKNWVITVRGVEIHIRYQYQSCGTSKKMIAEQIEMLSLIITYCYCTVFVLDALM